MTHEAEKKSSLLPKFWDSSEALIRPKSDALHEVLAVKDPSVVFFEGEWHVFATIATKQGQWSMVYFHFEDWAKAEEAEWIYLDQIPGFEGYTAAPQVFWFAPEDSWYLVFQAGPPKFSRTKNLKDPKTWSVPEFLYPEIPAIIEKNKGWLDFWMIGDSQHLYLFFPDDFGRLYRSQTSKKDFPRNFSAPQVIMEDPEAGRLFEACNVYYLKDQKLWLLLVEAFDASSQNARYFRAWTAESLSGNWTLLNDTADVPFAGAANVVFASKVWTKDISHGEVLRKEIDETMSIDSSDLQFLYQGFEPGANTSNYIEIPWVLGILSPSKIKSPI